MSTASDSQSGQRTDTESGPGEGTAPPTSAGSKGSGGQSGSGTQPSGHTSFRRCVLVFLFLRFVSVCVGLGSTMEEFERERVARKKNKKERRRYCSIHKEIYTNSLIESHSRQRASRACEVRFFISIFFFLLFDGVNAT